MFNEFLDSLFYHDDSNDLFKTKITNGKIKFNYKFFIWKSSINRIYNIGFR